MKSFIANLQPTLVTLLLFTILLGFVYPLATTAILSTGFRSQSEGSLLHDAKGQIIGSSLIGQNFSQPKYLWGRLSATGPAPYNAASSSGSNFGVNNPALLQAVQGRIDALKAADPGNKAKIPVDLVTASASGLDPEISPAAAAYQVGRIAKARHISEASVSAAIAKSTQSRTLGVLGEARVNVLDVNLRLDGQKS